MEKSNTKGTVLVTGGAGYIGSHTIIELLETGYRVISVDNFLNSIPAVFSALQKITGKKIKNYDINCVYQNELETVFKKEKIDHIIHFAALKSVEESVRKPKLYYKNNIGSLASVLALTKKYKVSTLIFSSSCTVYGIPKNIPVSESAPLQRATSPYGATKQLGEKMIIEAAADPANGMKAVLLRYFNPAGAHESGEIGEISRGKVKNVIPLIIQAALGQIPKFNVCGTDYQTRDGTAIRDYVHVSDIARAHVQAIAYADKKKSPTLSIFNLGTGTGTTVKELLSAFQKENKISVPHCYAPRRKGDVPAITASFKKAERLLGWKPTHTLADMVRSAWQWESSLRISPFIKNKK